MEEMKVREHGGWASYTYMKQNKTFHNCFKRDGKEGEGEMVGTI
jgi:hypothetical protein